MILGFVIGAVVAVASAALGAWAWLVRDFRRWW